MSQHGDRIGRGGRVFPIAGLVMALVVPAAIAGAAPVASAVSSTSCGPAVASGASFVVTCSNTGSEQTFSVPPGVTSLHVVAVGDAGHTNGGSGTGGGPGAITAADIPVVSGQTLFVEVGAGGGFGGANGGVYAGSGGGASDVRTCTVIMGLANSCNPANFGTGGDPRLVVAGGGGGVGIESNAGGAGGTPTGGNGTSATNRAGGGGGGTTAAGGAGGVAGAPDPQFPGEFGCPGQPGSAGAGGGGCRGGGGGGGGFFGGGGGGGGNGHLIGGGALGGGGGGGSSYAASSATNVSFGSDTSGRSSVTITYTPRPHVTLSKSASPSSGSAPLAVTYSYSLVNDGAETLFHVSVVDDKCSPVVLQGGDVNHDQLLQPGETWTFSCSATYGAAGSYTNHATAGGTSAATGLAVTSNTATATVTVGSPGPSGAHVTLSKSASPSSGSAPLAVTYSYSLVNDGAETLFHVSVVDDKCSPVVLQGGDVNHDQLLQPGETWTFSCSATYGAAGSYTNHATAGGTSAATGLAVTSNTATATVTVGSPGPSGAHVTLSKSASPSSGSAPLAVTYSYSLVNDGAETLFHVSVVDDKCSPVVLQGGDVNHDQLLQPGETWTFSCSATYGAAGSYTNHATAGGTSAATGLAVTSNTATATVTVGSPGPSGAHVTLSKSASPSSGSAPLAVTYSYSLVNDGAETLFHVSVVDDKCSPVVLQGGDVNHDQLLQPGETWTFSCSATYGAAGSYTNHATAGGTSAATGLAVTSNTATATVTVGPPSQV